MWTVVRLAALHVDCSVASFAALLIHVYLRTVRASAEVVNTYYDNDAHYITPHWCRHLQQMTEQLFAFWKVYKSLDHLFH